MVFRDCLETKWFLETSFTYSQKIGILKFDTLFEDLTTNKQHHNLQQITLQTVQQIT